MEENKIENSVLEENSNVEANETHAENSTSDTKDVDASNENSEIKNSLDFIIVDFINMS